MVCALCAGMWGCGDTCFEFRSNSGSGNIKVVTGDVSCRIAKPLGAAQFRIGTSSAWNPKDSENVAAPPAVRHIFVTLRGVEGHEDPAAAMDAANWQQLAPELVEHPVQVDLLAALDDSSVLPAATGARAPAGVYRQIRLELLPRSIASARSDTEAGAAAPMENGCGNLVLHCVVLEDRTIRPLLIDSEDHSEALGHSAIRISADRIAGGTLVILPGATRTYEIELQPFWLMSSASGEAVRLIPVFSVSPR
jgi:hypothetical protein